MLGGELQMKTAGILVALSPFVFAGPASAGFIDNMLEDIGKTTLDATEAIDRAQEVVDLGNVVAEPITWETAASVFARLRALDATALHIVEVGVGACEMVDCAGVPSEIVSSMAKMVLADQQRASDLEQTTWTRGLSVVAIAVSALSLLLNLVLGVMKAVQDRRTGAASA